MTLPRLGTVDVGLRGRHQAANVAVADALLDALDLAGIARSDDDARRRGYAAAVWPGRLELLTVDGHEVLLDGAHNPAGAAALAVALADLRPYLAPGPITLVTASMADKDVDGVIDALAAGEPLRGATVIATTVDAPRALPAEDLAARWRGRSAGRARRGDRRARSTRGGAAGDRPARPDRRRRLAVPRRGGPGRSRRRSAAARSGARP